MKTKLITTIGVLLLLGVFYGFYLFNKPHRNAADIEPKLAITATELISKFETDKNAVSGTLMNQILEISGIIYRLHVIDDLVLLTVTLTETGTGLLIHHWL